MEKKTRNTSGTYLPKIFLTNLLGWLVISHKCPKHFFGHYPSAILLEISPTNSPCRNFTYTRICSNRSVFLYTKQNLQQKMFTPKNFFTRRGFTPNSFLHQEPLIRKGFYTRNLYHHRHLTPNIFFIYTYTRTPENSYKKHSGLFLQQEPYTPKGFYTIGNLHQRAFTPRDSYSKRIAPNSFYAGQLLHQKTFTPELFTSQSFEHQNLSYQPTCTTKYVYMRSHLRQIYSFRSQGFYTRGTSHQRAFTPKPFYTKQCLHQ